MLSQLMATTGTREAVFDERDRRQFRRNGFLVLPGALDDDLMAEARTTIGNDDTPDSGAELQRMMDADDEDLELDVEGRGVKMFGGADGGVCIASAVHEEPFRTINERVFEYAEALVGEDQLAPPDASTRITLRFPNHEDLFDPDAEQPSDLGTHIDGINTDSERLVTIGAAIYVDRVQPRGGGFTVWPGSHRLAGRYFETLDPDDYGEAGGGLPRWTGDGWDHDGNLREQFDPVEVSGSAGTVTMWHGHMEHSGGVNLSPSQTRIALFTRFRLHEDHYDIELIAPDPFYGWTAMDGVDIDAIE
jgi:hypothetical protein